MIAEHKTTADSIDSASDYWLQLRFDPQISVYVVAAQGLGYDIDEVLYNVVRKPTIRPHRVPLLDDDGLKIVQDQQGQRIYKPVGKPDQSGFVIGKPRQSADSTKGYELLTRPETPEEWEARLLGDIGERPEWYFARHVVSRLADDLIQFRRELWQQAQSISESRRRGWWYRNVGKWTCSNCDYRNICLLGITVDPNQPPVGFERISHANPELIGDE